MWDSKNKADLIFEVWEKLDCESVGRVEIEAIETAVASAFGVSAVDTPMRLARMLADEGAELRHSEIMELHVERASDIPFEAELRDLIDLKDHETSLRSIRDMENLRRALTRDQKREGLRLLREKAIKAKDMAKASSDGMLREVAEWLTIWLQSPELFENWIILRRNSQDYKQRFGKEPAQ